MPVRHSWPSQGADRVPLSDRLSTSPVSPLRISAVGMPGFSDSAAAALTMPAPRSLPPLVAVAFSRAVIWAGVASGWTLLYRAATPATTGEAMEVPLLGP